MKLRKRKVYTMDQSEFLKNYAPVCKCCDAEATWFVYFGDENSALTPKMYLCGNHKDASFRRNVGTATKAVPVSDTARD